MADARADEDFAGEEGVDLVVLVEGMGDGCCVAEFCCNKTRSALHGRFVGGWDVR